MQNISLDNSAKSGSIDMDDVKSCTSQDDAWEKVSYADLNLDGMNDPYANKFKNIIAEQKAIS